MNPINQNKICCEKCLNAGYMIFPDQVMCLNATCPCHSDPVSEVSKTSRDIVREQLHNPEKWDKPKPQEKLVLDRLDKLADDFGDVKPQKCEHDDYGASEVRVTGIPGVFHKEEHFCSKCKKELFEDTKMGEWAEWIDVGVNSWLSQDKDGNDYMNEDDIVNLKTHLSKNYIDLLSREKEESKQELETLHRVNKGLAEALGREKDKMLEKIEGMIEKVPEAKEDWDKAMYHEQTLIIGRTQALEDLKKII